MELSIYKQMEKASKKKEGLELTTHAFHHQRSCSMNQA
jgi:hypothetical protein